MEITVTESGYITLFQQTEELVEIFKKCKPEAKF
jgi:hypothetical protein